jgi:hypothetical protein
VSDPRDEISEHGPTELVPDDKGELVERLSGGTATLLLVWLSGIGAGSALLGVWIFSLVLFDTRLGVNDLFGGPGFYTALAGASGPCILWLAGRAQGHDLAWFLLTAAKIGLVMIVIVMSFFVVSMLMFGLGPGPGAPLAAALAIGFTLVASMLWGIATWLADRWIARARVHGE